MQTADALLAAAMAMPEPRARAQALVGAGTAFEREGNAAGAAQCFYQSFQLVASRAAAEGAARAYAAARKWEGAVGWLDAALKASTDPADTLRLLKAKGRILQTELRDAAGTQRVLEQIRALEPAQAPPPAPVTAPVAPVPAQAPPREPAPSLPPPVATGHADLEFVDTPDEPPLELETVVRVQASASGVPAEPPPATTEPVVREESPAPGRRIPVWAIAAAALLGVGVIVGRSLSSPSDTTCPPGSAPGEQVVEAERLVGCLAVGRFEGQVEVRDLRGVLVARRTYVSGEATGPAEEFDASGTVGTGLLRKGLRQGVWLYTRKGKRVEEGAWDGGVAVGPWSRYDPDTAARLETIDRSADAGADAGAEADAGPAVIEVVSSQDLERLYGGHRVSHWRNVLLAADLAGTGALVRTRAARAGLTIAADGGLSP